MARMLEGTSVRVRRSARRDADRVLELLGRETGDSGARRCRRQLADRTGDIYVAESSNGRLVAVVAIAYARSLMRDGWAAVLDGVRQDANAAEPLLGPLIALAEERARRRGCRRMLAWVDPTDAPLRAALAARAYQGAEVLVAELGGGR